jgi:DNA-binding PucR family transcriptional regulator
VDRRSVLIAQLPRGRRTLPGRWLRDVHCGLAPVAGSLAAVPRAARIATALAEVAGGEHGPRRLTDAWPALVAARLAELGEALAADVLTGVDRAGRHERDRLLETVSVYLRRGSVGRAAAELFCHRNTVLNRIRRFAHLTGCDVTRPEQAALAMVALACRDASAAVQVPEPAEPTTL